MVLIGRPLMPIVFDVRWLPLSPSPRRNQEEAELHPQRCRLFSFPFNKKVGPGALHQRRKTLREISQRDKFFMDGPKPGVSWRERKKNLALTRWSSYIRLSASISWCLDASGGERRRWKLTRCPNSATLRTETSGAARCISGCISDTLWVIQAPGAVKGTFCKLLVIYCRLLFNRSWRRSAVLTALRQRHLKTRRDDAARRHIHSLILRGN